VEGWNLVRAWTLGPLLRQDFDGQAATYRPADYELRANLFRVFGRVLLLFLDLRGLLS